MSDDISKFLGGKVSLLLSEDPFSKWDYKKYVENDLDEPIVTYEFQREGLELRCNRNEEIKVIFLPSIAFVEAHRLLPQISGASTRQDLMNRFGEPEKIGNATVHPILGEIRPWDRFWFGEHKLHVQYLQDGSHIERITLIGR